MGNRTTPEESREIRDQMEEELSEATGRAVRRFLARTTAYCRKALRGPLVASADPWQPASTEAPVPNLTIAPSGDWLSYGQVAKWWDDSSKEVVQGVADSWQKAYGALGYEPGDNVGSSLDPSNQYLAKVRDRLVQGIQPPLPQAAFDKIRGEISYATNAGLSTADLSRNIGVTLGWDQNREHWEREYSTAAGRIDALLDPLGEPGSAAREAFKATDPTVRALQGRMGQARKAMDAGETYWKTRADRIARTESTGAYNFAALSTLAEDGAKYKKWMVTEDSRTRPSHAAADGQSVEMDKPFTVGGASMQMPCDPTAPAREVVNCRCTIVGDWDREDAEDAAQTAMPPAHPAPPVVPQMSQAERDQQLLASDDALWDLDTDELDALSMRQVEAGDFMAAERVGEIAESKLARQEFPEMDLTANSSGILTPDVYDWYEKASPRVQEEFFEVLDKTSRDLSDEFSIQLQAYLEGRSAARIRQAYLPSAREIRADYDDYLDRELLNLENETNGAMLTKEAWDAGIKPRNLYSANWATARSWASEETLQYWQDNGGRMTFEAFKEQATGNTGAATERRLKNTLDW